MLAIPEFSNDRVRYVIKKTSWASVMVIGLFVALSEFLLYPISVPTTIPEPATATAEEIKTPVPVASGNSNEERVVLAMQTPNAAKQEVEVPVITVPVQPQKSWLDYGDKIVGWIVALAGAFNLVRGTRKKEDESK